MSEMEKVIGIAGYGRVGGSMAMALHRRGWEVHILTRFPDDAPFRFYPEEEAEEFIKKAHNFIIAVRDSHIGETARRLARYHVEGRIFLHLSGALTSRELEPLKERGAFVGSFHPLQTFPRRDPSLLKGIHFAFEGDEEALSLARTLAQEFGSSLFHIDPGKKTLYHAAAVFASNFADAMWIIADMLMREASDADFSVMEPLVRTTLENALRMGPEKALTGPARRRDILTIRKHLEELKKYPHLERIYEDITGFILQHFEEENP